MVQEAPSGTELRALGTSANTLGSVPCQESVLGRGEAGEGGVPVIFKCLEPLIETSGRHLPSTGPWDFLKCSEALGVELEEASPHLGAPGLFCGAQVPSHPVIWALVEGEQWARGGAAGPPCWNTGRSSPHLEDRTPTSGNLTTSGAGGEASLSLSS